MKNIYSDNANSNDFPRPFPDPNLHDQFIFYMFS